MANDFELVQDFGLCAGDIANLRLGMFGGAPIVLKQAREAGDADLLQNEARVLRTLMKNLLDEKCTNDSVSWCIPQIIGTKPGENLIEFFPGFMSVEDIRKISTGVDGRSLVWMWKRLLTLLSWVHHFGYIHGAVLPPHVLYWPDGPKKDERTHSVKLVDWCYAIDYKKEHKLKAWIPDFKDFYPPEVLNKQIVGPQTDLYMAAATMIYLAGGDVKSKKVPSKIPGQLANAIKKCLEPQMHKRPDNIGEYFDAFVATSKDVYGDRKFHEFKLAL